MWLTSRATRRAYGAIFWRSTLVPPWARRRGERVVDFNLRFDELIEHMNEVNIDLHAIPDLTGRLYLRGVLPGHDLLARERRERASQAEL